MAEKTSVALGLFDGVHLGHRKVLELALKSSENGTIPAVFTFAPENVLHKPTGKDGYIYDSQEKQRILREMGFNTIYSPHFSHVCHMTGEAFAKEILVKRLNVAEVFCGENFHFGKNASCGVADLRKFGEKLGFRVTVAEDAFYNGKIVSSGEIRQLLLNGDIVGANELLGCPYAVSAQVVDGAKLGRTIGFPTANQLYRENQLVPKFGVYRGKTEIDGVTYSTMTNIGRKPTVNYGGIPLAETYICGFSGDIYGRIIQVKLLEFIRPEKKFNSVEELTAQIAEDIEAVRKNS